jgi:hypothetical protein
MVLKWDDFRKRTVKTAHPVNEFEKKNSIKLISFE